MVVSENSETFLDNLTGPGTKHHYHYQKYAAPMSPERGTVVDEKIIITARDLDSPRNWYHSNIIPVLEDIKTETPDCDTASSDDRQPPPLPMIPVKKVKRKRKL